MKEQPAAIEVLEERTLFLQRESGRTHTPYETEQLFYSCIRAGDVERVGALMQTLLRQTVVAGKLSNDPLRQMQYWAVCCITLATRCAIQGGLDETTAFNRSDESILEIDRMRDPQEILRFLQSLCLQITALVRDSRFGRDAPQAVRKCLHYIQTNLHSRLTADVLAKACALSPDYLCALFKRHVGVPLSVYIRSQRLYAARELLLTGKGLSEIA
ncbi:MAG: helix-turn-helix domain-containing protein, partial [Clostridia bacterium]|nr:helix-turn-helix domain-containing protein [Clostridia bacterium]